METEAGGRKRYTAKFSEDKITLPGAKQIFRYPDHDVVGLAEESFAAPEVETLLRPVILGGRLVEPPPEPKAARDRASQTLARLPEACRRLDDPEPYPVEYSRGLMALLESIKMGLEGTRK